MSSIRFYQSGDYDNTIQRKLLENEGATIAGSQSVYLDAEGGSLPPSFPALGDVKNTLLRKFLKNQTQAMDGRSSIHIR